MKESTLKEKEDTLKENPFFRVSLGVVAIMAVLFLTVAGCTKQAPSPSVNPAPAPTDTPTADIKEVEVQKEDAKTEPEKTNDQILTLVPDGTYVDEVSYNNPGGGDSFEITVEVKDDAITGISLVGIVPVHQVSGKYMNAVNLALPNMVIGKKIDEISLPKQISGSSLTSAAVAKYLKGMPDKY